MQLSDFDEFVAVLRFLKTPNIELLSLEYNYSNLGIVIHHGLAVLCDFWAQFYLRLPSASPSASSLLRVNDVGDACADGNRPVLRSDNQEHVVTGSLMLALRSQQQVEINCRKTHVVLTAADR
jgi:hypothetical protein